MSRVLLVFTTVLFSMFASVASQTWYTLGFYSGSYYITGLSGVMIAPRRPSFSGTYYVWPGLQPKANGVLQEVCDGRSGSWWMGSGWCCSNPSLPWGSGISVNPGDQVTFSNVGTSSGTWTCSVSKPGTAAAVSTFALGTINPMSYAYFAVELYSVGWDFGPVIYENVQIQTNDPSTSICSQSLSVSGSTGYVINGVSSSSNSQGALCTYSSIYMWNSAASTLDFLNQLPTAAYSLRLLTQSYHGYAIRVRRSSDGTTSDIGFVSGALDTATLLTFAGTGNAFITIWYDQSGNGNNAVQSTAANQPQIVSSGAVITLGSKPTILFNHANSNFFSLTSYPFQAAASGAAYVVNGVRTIQSWQRYFDFGYNTSVNIFATPTSSNAFRLTVGGSGAEQGVSGTLLSTTNQINMAQFHHYGTSAGTMSAQDSIGSTNLNSASSVTLAPSAINGATNNYLGKSQYSDPYFDGWMSEVIFFSADPYYTNQAAQESAFFSNIKSFYGF